MSLSENYKLSQRIVQNERQLERLLAILSSSDVEQAKTKWFSMIVENKGPFINDNTPEKGRG